MEPATRRRQQTGWEGELQPYFSLVDMLSRSGVSNNGGPHRGKGVRGAARGHRGHASLSLSSRSYERREPDVHLHPKSVPVPAPGANAGPADVDDVIIHVIRGG